MLKFRPLVVGALAALPLFCVETKFWQQGEYADFEKGTRNKVSIRSDGRLSLAPVVHELLDSSTPYLWAAAQDSKGNLYVGGGAPTASTAKLFQVDAQGKSKVIAELEGLEIHAIAIDSRDRVYAATAPDGKVYRITGGKSEVFFDPKAKYIWALAISRGGDLFVATGDRGDIYRVKPDGQGSVFFRTEETHARSLALDKDDNLIAGTEPGGVVLRVTPAGEGFVLYQTPKREVTAVAVAPDGSIYAAAVGNKGASSPQSTPVQAPPPPAPPSSPAGGAQIVVSPAKPGGSSAPPPSFSSAAALTGGSEIYCILPDGSPRKVWSHGQDVAYAIAFDKQGRPVIGTGNKGDIYRIDSELNYTLLVNVAPTQVTGFATGRNGQIYAVTGNIGKLFQIGPDLEKQGSFESETFDAGAFTYWGRLSYVGELAGGRLGFFVRSGNVSQTQKNWSGWTPVTLAGDGGRTAAPNSRFLQYKVTLDAAADGRSPEIGAVEIAHMPKNVAPIVREIETTPSNYKFSTSAIVITPSATPQSLTLPPMGNKRPSPSVSMDVSGGSQTMTYSKGGLGARWLAQDDNGDTLVFKIEIRGVGETQWKLLRDHVRERYIGWDGTAFPDGRYVLRVSASDSPSNPPDQALRAELVSDPFVIDNTPPQISALTGTAAGGKINVQWKAKDALSIIEKAEYSINGGEWIVVEPATRLSDAPELDYKLTIDRPAAGGEFTIAVRVTDEYDNQSVEKVVVR
jgi:hypothetical protein